MGKRKTSPGCPGRGTGPRRMSTWTGLSDKAYGTLIRNLRQITRNKKSPAKRILFSGKIYFVVGDAVYGIRKGRLKKIIDEKLKQQVLSTKGVEALFF